MGTAYPFLQHYMRFSRSDLQPSPGADFVAIGDDIKEVPIVLAMNLGDFTLAGAKVSTLLPEAEAAPFFCLSCLSNRLGSNPFFLEALARSSLWPG